MERNFTLSNEFLEGQQPNTAVLPRNDLFPQLMLQASEMQYRRKQNEKAAHEKQVADMVKALDYDTADMHIPDQELSQKEIQDYTKKWTTGSNMNSFIMSQENLPLILQRKQDEQKLKFGIDVGKQAKVIADENFKLMQQHPDLYDVDAGTKYINEWLSAPRDKRGVFQGLPTRNQDNPLLTAQKLLNANPPQEVTHDVKNSDGTFTKQGYKRNNPIGLLSTMLSDFNGEGGQDKIKTFDATTQDILAGNLPNQEIPVYETDINKGLIDPKTGDWKVIGKIPYTQADNFQKYMFANLPSTYVNVPIQNIEGSVYHPPKDSDGTAKNLFPYYSSGAVTTNIKQAGGGSTEKVESGKFETDANGKTKYGADGKAIPIMVDKEVPSKVGIYNGNVYSSPNEQPKNVPIDPPNQAYDIESGKWLTKNDIGTGVWTVSLVKDGTIYRKQNSTGGYNWLGYDPANPNPDKKGYTAMDMVQVTNDEGKTLLIPKNGDILEYISKLKREEGGGSTTTTPTQSSGTQQQGGVKSGGGAFDDLGTTPQKKSQVTNTPTTNQQVAPQKQVVTPQNNTQTTTTPQQTVTPPPVTPTQTTPTTVKTPTVNSVTAPESMSSKLKQISEQQSNAISNKQSLPKKQVVTPPTNTQPAPPTVAPKKDMVQYKKELDAYVDESFSNKNAGLNIDNLDGLLKDYKDNNIELPSKLKKYDDIMNNNQIDFLHTRDDYYNKKIGATEYTKKQKELMSPLYNIVDAPTVTISATDAPSKQMETFLSNMPNEFIENKNFDTQILNMDSETSKKVLLLLKKKINEQDYTVNDKYGSLQFEFSGDDIKKKNGTKINSILIDKEGDISNDFSPIRDKLFTPATENSGATMDKIEFDNVSKSYLYPKDLATELKIE